MSPPLTPLAQALLSIVMLGSILCAVGGAWLLAKRRERRKAWLLLVMSLVLLGNVLVWAL